MNDVTDKKLRKIIKFSYMRGVKDEQSHLREIEDYDAERLADFIISKFTGASHHE